MVFMKVGIIICIYIYISSIFCWYFLVFIILFLRLEFVIFYGNGIIMRDDFDFFFDVNIFVW